jgi:uncharacterized protein (TIGR03437 family)
MKRRMCRIATSGWKWAALAPVLLLFAASGLKAQVFPLEWRRVGGPAFESGLASPAGGPVDRVWFGEQGQRLLIRTVAGRVFATSDFETWTTASAEPPPAPERPVASRLPARVSALKADPTREGRLYAWGDHIYRSDDGGRAWLNLTASGTRSVIGSRVRDLAVSPTDPDVLIAGTDFGVWRTSDGGRTWIGLNETLANSPIRKVLSPPRGAEPLRVWSPTGGVLELRSGSGSGWHPTRDAAYSLELERRRALSASLEAEITATAAGGELLHAGSSDGRIWTSRDRGRTWVESSQRGRGPVEAIVVDADDPRVAIAAIAGPGPRILRTTNGGLFWDDISANLPPGPAYGVSFDRAARALYAATERGVFLSRTDLNAAGPPESWAPVPGLDANRAWDVRLDPVKGQLFAVLDEAGVFAAPAPHRAGALRWMNAADLSTRPAAPGSLVSLQGAAVSRAQAGLLSVPVLASSPSESQIQVPFEAAGDVLPLSVAIPGRQLSVGIPMQPVSPAIFVDADGSPLLVDGDSGLLLDAANVARGGGRVQILATGLGRVSPDWPTGLAAPLEGAPRVRAEVSAFLDRAAVPVTRATLAPGYIGFYLVEIELPPIVNAGPAELYLTAGGQESNRVRIYLAP